MVVPNRSNRDDEQRVLRTQLDVIILLNNSLHSRNYTWRVSVAISARPIGSTYGVEQIGLTPPPEEVLGCGCKAWCLLHDAAQVLEGRYIDNEHGTNISIRRASGDLRQIHVDSAIFRVRAETCSTGTYLYPQR